MTELDEMKQAAAEFEEAYKRLLANGLVKESYRGMMNSLIIGVQSTIKRMELTA